MYPLKDWAFRTHSITISNSSVQAGVFELKFHFCVFAEHLSENIVEATLPYKGLTNSFTLPKLAIDNVEYCTLVSSNGALSNISSVVEFQRWWALKCKIFAMWWPGFKNFIWFFEMEEHGASEAHKNEFLNYEVLKI